jgi:hypothetical protein
MDISQAFVQSDTLPAGSELYLQPPKHCTIVPLALFGNCTNHSQYGLMEAPGVSITIYDSVSLVTQ